jgi:ribosome-binding protein aMBF1 (putative translation factor)
MAKIVLLEDYRQAIRAARERPGLSRTTLERAAKVGQTYGKRVETGRRQSPAVTLFRRLLKALRQRAEQEAVPAKTKAGLLRVVKKGEKQGENTAKR